MFLNSLVSLNLESSSGVSKVPHLFNVKKIIQSLVSYEVNQRHLMLVFIINIKEPYPYINENPTCFIKDATKAYKNVN